MSDTEIAQDVRVWKPTIKQENFLALPDSIFEALYGGAVFSGKSELLVLLPLARRFHLHPKFKGIILRRTFPELEKEIITRSLEYYGAAGGIYNKQEKKWRFPSGAQIHFGHAENESDIRRYDGVEYNLVAFDELPSFTGFQYLYMFTRCRSSSPDLPAIVRSSAMPGGVGHDFVRTRFVDPAPNGSKIIVDVRTGFKRFFLKSLPTDNPYGMKNDPSYIARLELLPEGERRAKLGDWYTYQGQVFSNFRIEALPDEPANASHVCEPFDIPNWWPKVLSGDWGYQANTDFQWGAIAPNGRVYIYREFTVTKTDIAIWAPEIVELSNQDKNIRIFKLDTNAWDHRGEEKTIAEQFTNFATLSKHEALRNPEPASKGRISGKILIQEYLRWMPRPKVNVREEFNTRYADILLRHKGIDEYNSYLERFRPEEEETNLPKLQIFSTCEELIRTIPICIYDDKNREDVKPFEGDDAYDNLRYLLKGIVKYLDESKGEMSQLRKLAEIQDKLAQTNDFTSYHLQRARIEAGNIAKNQPISRFHKRVRRMSNSEGIFGD